MARLIDPDDLIDTAGVAELLGLASRSVVSVYRGRYPDFPAPVVDQGACRLWLRSDVEAWGRATGRVDRQ